MFGSQVQVDRYIDDVAYTFGVTRSALNVDAAAKGLVAGAARFNRKDGSTLNAALDREGLLAPTLKEINSVSMETVKWLFVVEKEASFRSILSSSLWDTISTQAIILTGKGYPDLASRALLRYLSTPSSQNGFVEPKVYGLADFDPDGISILSIFQNGSWALPHERDAHCVPRLQRLGLNSGHILDRADGVFPLQGLLILTKRDRNKAIRALKENEMFQSHDYAARRHELQIMLLLNVKAELQFLDTVPDGTANLLRSVTTVSGGETLCHRRYSIE